MFESFDPTVDTSYPQESRFQTSRKWNIFLTLQICCPVCVSILISVTHWKLQSKCLQTMFMPADLNGETLAESLGLQESKQVCLTTDNGSNLVRAAHLLKWLHVPCFGHNLHLATTNAIKDDSLSRAIGVTRKHITSFTHSWKKKSLQKIKQILVYLTILLITDCQARWRQVLTENYIKNS